MIIALWTEEQWKEEADRLGWTVEYLKAHYRKEDRIMQTFKRIQKEADDQEHFELKNKDLAQRLKERVF